MPIAACLLLTGICFADLRPPREETTADSASVRLEQWVEFRRLTEYFSTQQTISPGIRMAARGRWRTDWQNQRDGRDRVRQDGIWYGGISRPLYGKLDLWIAGAGEHFDERSAGSASQRFSNVEVQPRNPDLRQTSILPSAQSVNATRILRGGAGVSMAPWEPLTLSSAIGGVDDRRIGQHESGLGSWSHLNLRDWNTGGYQHEGSFTLLRELPRNHHRLDLTGDYQLFREFFPGNSNRARLTAGLLERDVLRTADQRVSRREEHFIRFRDQLRYEVASGVSIQMEGDLQREYTDLGEQGAGNSSLEEEQTGLVAAIKGRLRSHSARLSVGVRSISQTIRGDILIGRKSNVSLKGESRLPDRSVLRFRLAVSKYTLDTRSDQNFDDRDELGFRMESRWTKLLFGNLLCELRLLANLDHLVYIFEENSANNRWSRLFRAAAMLQHRPTSAITQRFHFAISANYQDYDFEFNPKSTRSTVFRRYLAGDSVAVRIYRRLSVLAELEYEIEELGRLYWEEFEEARSDETTSWYAATSIQMDVTKSTSGSIGYLWDSRRGDHFLEGSNSERTLFQNLRSYGPTGALHYDAKRGFYLRGNGRALRQLDLNQDPRWIISGELIGGLRW